MIKYQFSLHSRPNAIRHDENLKSGWTEMIERLWLASEETLKKQFHYSWTPRQPEEEEKAEEKILKGGKLFFVLFEIKNKKAEAR